MIHEYGIIDRDNETPVVWGLRSLEEAQIALKAKQAELDGGWKIVDFTTGQTILTDREYNKASAITPRKNMRNQMNLKNGIGLKKN